MADERTRRVLRLLQAFVVALQRDDKTAAIDAYEVLERQAAALRESAASAGRSSGARAPAPLPPAILDACAALLERHGPSGDMAAFVMGAVTLAAKAVCTEAPVGPALLGHARFARWARPVAN